MQTGPNNSNRRSQPSSVAPAASSAARSSCGKQAKPIRVLITEDHTLIRELISAWITEGPQTYEIVGHAATAEEAIDACRKAKPNVLILDNRLPGKSGIEAIASLKSACPSLRVLLCSGSANEADILTAIRNGVDGFIEKTSSREELLVALARVAHGAHFFCARSSEVLLEAALGKFKKSAGYDEDCPITLREKEVVALIASGRTTREIAQSLNLSAATIDTHRRNIMAKIGARNAADLVRYAHEHSLAETNR